jgi:hypothetical protein
MDMSGRPIEAKLEPSLDGLANNKEIQRDATEVIGLFAPVRYGITTHAGYNINLFGDNYRSAKSLKARHGSPYKRIGMYFNGATGDFEELPKAEDLNPKELNELFKRWGKTQTIRLYE